MGLTKQLHKPLTNVVCSGQINKSQIGTTDGDTFPNFPIKTAIRISQ
jgi:hypothetical protein